MDLTRAIFSGLVLAAAVSAQGPLPGVTQDWSKVEQRVAWHGTWAAAEAAAADEAAAPEEAAPAEEAPAEEAAATEEAAPAEEAPAEEAAAEEEKAEG